MLTAIPMLAVTETSLPVTTNGVAQRRLDSFGDRDRVAHVGDVLQQHGELVAAEARDRVLGPHARLHALSDGDQQPVAGVVTEAVVDRLELVQVEEQDGDRGPAAVGPLECVVEAVREQRAVGKLGERVVEGLVCELVEPLLVGRA